MRRVEKTSRDVVIRSQPAAGVQPAPLGERTSIFLNHSSERRCNEPKSIAMCYLKWQWTLCPETLKSN